ncbi:hypothetical protein JIQ42_04949 [Leishmania sp. Namibia]|uniref:hypothetical protein n=1 Tax=Leishmania sp. Namibia TaxID=2802991 RepID=UPI001B55162E|nr:hypothetical protein JIQ42_04949 [Leishmania sp. Namibia]
MRRARPPPSVRRLCEWAVAPWRLKPGAVGLSRRCSTVADGTAPSASTKLPNAPPPPPLSSPTTPSAGSNASSGAATLFDLYFHEVLTTLDIAPIKRPHVVGSLVCAMEEYPISVVLVEGCCGTSAEAVTESVRRSAIHSAQGMREVSRKSTKAFLVQHLCTARPRVVELLDALDLSLRVRLLRQDDLPPAADDEKGAKHHDRSGVSGVSSQHPNKWTGQRWRCSAALYDVWHTQPCFTPVERAATGSEEAEHDEVGELLDVLGITLMRVEEQLRQLRGRYARDTVEEACRFLKYAGGDFCEKQLTQRCLSMCMEGGESAPHNAEQRCPWWGESRARRRWSLQCDAVMDANNSKAVAFHLCLTCTLHAICSVDISGDVGVTAVLHSAQTHRGLAQLVDKAAGGVLRRYTNLVSCSVLSQDLYSVSALARMSAKGCLSTSKEWTCGPVDLANHVVTAAAVLSPTVAYDWIGATRGVSDAASHEALFGTLGAESNALNAGLPACVRWSSFVGRAHLNDFAVRVRGGNAAAGRSGAGGSCALPPLWPQLGLLHGSTTESRCVALRELLRHEHGLRGLPRVLVEVSAASSLLLEYDAELIVNDGDADLKRLPNATTRKPTSIQVLCGDCYADVAAAAQVHTPWAAPLCEAAPAPPPPSTAAAKCDRNVRADSSPPHVHTGNRTDGATSPALDEPPCISVDVLSLSDSMSAMGFTSATWMASTAKLVVKRSVNASPVVFEGANTVSGYRRMLRFSAKKPVYKTVYLSPRHTVQEALQRLLDSMAASRPDTDDHLAHGKRGDDDSPGADGTEAVIRGRERTMVGRRPVGRSGGLMLVFPFNAGAAAVQANMHTAKETQRALFSAVQEHCRDPTQLSWLMFLPKMPAGKTFFHSWPLTAPWLASRGSRLEASLTPVVDGGVAAPRRGCGEKSTKASVEGGAVEYDLRLSINASPFASSVERGGASVPCSAPLPTVLVTRLPASAAWLSTAYTAVRKAVKLIHPDLFAQGDNGAAASTALASEAGRDNATGQHWLLVRCATFTQVVEALLFTTAFSHNSAFSAQDLLKELFGDSVYVKKRESATELWLVVAPRMPPVRLCTVDQRDGQIGVFAARRWLMLLQRVMDACCPEAGATVEAMRHLQERVSALATENDCGGPPLQCLLSCEWARRPAGGSESPPAEWAQVFVAELQRCSPAPLQAASNPRWSRVSLKQRQGDAAVQSGGLTTATGSPATVVHREEGPDSFGVLWRMLHCAALQPSETAELSSAVSGQALSRAPIPSPSGFIKAAQRALALQRGLARVTHRYHKSLGGVVVEGWRSPRQTLSQAPCDTPITLVAEPMPLHCIPLRLTQLYHRLLVEADSLRCMPEELRKEFQADWEATPTHKIVKSLCETLSCRPADLQLVETRFSKVWVACLELPLRIFGFSDATAPSSSSSSPDSPCCDAPQSLYLHCHCSSKRQAIRSVYTLLYQWTRYPQVEAPAKDVEFYVARYKGASLRSWAADAASSPSVSSPWPETTIAARPKSQMSTGAATGASEARASQTPPQALRTLRSVLEAAHARMEASIGSLVDCRDGRVTLQLSQTFGLQLMYSVSAAGALEKVCAKDSVQLLREPWAPLMWAPAQVLCAEVSVLKRLLTHSIAVSDGGDVNGATDDVRGVLRELIFTGDPVQLASLQSGPNVRAKEFCVSFFRRYFGWRVCERSDVNDISVGDGHSSVVIVQTSEEAPLSRGGQRCGSQWLASPRHRGAVRFRELEHATATLQLTQIVPGAKTSVRLGRILVEVKGATPQAASDTLWEPCTAQIDAVFGVSCRMSPREADDQMLRFMQSQLE